MMEKKSESESERGHALTPLHVGGEERLVVVDAGERRWYGEGGLVGRVYEELMVPAFGRFPDELEPLASWRHRLLLQHARQRRRQHDEAHQVEVEEEEEEEGHVLHVLIVLRVPDERAPSRGNWTETSSGTRLDSSPPFIRMRRYDRSIIIIIMAGTMEPWWTEEEVGTLELVGATACEYYGRSNCGLLTYVTSIIIVPLAIPKPVVDRHNGTATPQLTSNGSGKESGRS